MRTGRRSSVLTALAAFAILTVLPMPGQARDMLRARSTGEAALPVFEGTAQWETTCVYTEDFQQGNGGWVPVDKHAGMDPVWNRSTYWDGEVTRDVMWCGVDEPGWPASPGYGNNWTQDLSKSFDLPPGTPQVIYQLQYDTEPDFDFLYLDVSDDGGASFTNLEIWDGNSSGFKSDTTDLSAYESQSVILRFRFVSDISFSDEDGNYDTDGAARLDSIAVTGFPVDAFTSDACGWTASVPPSIDASYRLEAVPGCETGFECPDYCYAWVAYDTLTGEFPYEELLGQPVEIGIQSPAISVPTDADWFLLQFDVYLNLPMYNLVFYTWEVSPDGGPWTTDGNVTYGTGGFSTVRKELALYVPQGTAEIRVRVMGKDMWGVWHDSYPYTGVHTAAPFFDNVAIYAMNTVDPGIDDSNFPSPCGADEDGDGVFGDDDDCPTTDASFFDSYGDGCIDYGAGCRHVEYWDRSVFPLTYYISDGGAPGVNDGSDTLAIQAGMNAWTGVPNVVASAISGGPRPQTDARALDGINLVTFDDPDYRFGAGTIAVGITTSFDEPTFYANRWHRAGEMFDMDMIFNPAMSFRTATDGPAGGTYIETVAMHEAGHLFGISHSAVTSSCMYFVLPPGLGTGSLSDEDQRAMYKAYGDQTHMASASRLWGTVMDGYTSNPLPGAAVFAISATQPETLGCEYTLPDGSFEFIGLPDGQYYVSVHPINGSSGIGYLWPGYINHLVDEIAVTVFVPEYWDLAESSDDDPAAKDPLTVSAGAATAAHIITNVDDDPPYVTGTIPDSNATGISIDTAILLKFSEPLNTGTLQGNFSLVDTTTDEFIPGNASFLMDDSLIAYIPLAGLRFESTYELTIGTGLEDLFGNGLAEPFTMLLTTEDEPDVALASLSPSKGVPGMIVSLAGNGFDPEPANNTVSFNGVPAAISDASPTQLIVTVPDTATSGAVNVYNHTQGLVSNDLQFSVLTTDEAPKGFASGTCALSGTPHALTVLLDGSYAFVATDAGAEAVVTDPAQGGYMTATTIPVSGGLSGIDAGPGGSRVYGVSNVTKKFYRINSTPGYMGVLSEKPIDGVPLGIFVHPRGHRAYIPTEDGRIQTWDIKETSPTFETQIGTIVPNYSDLRAEMASGPGGDPLLAITGTGRLLFIDQDSMAVASTVTLDQYPRGIAIDPALGRAYVCGEMGIMSIVSLTSQQVLWKVRIGGILKSIAVTPAGTFALVVNRELNLLNAIDLRETSSSFLSVVATIDLPINPVDLELSPDGDYAFSISEAQKYLVATTVGLGPSLVTLSRPAAPHGSRLVLAGSEFATDSTAAVSFDGMEVETERLTDNSITVEVPGGAASGPVSVVTYETGGRRLESNPIYLGVLGSTEEDMLRLAAALRGAPSPAVDAGSVMQVAPDGGFIAVADREAGLHILILDEGSPDYNRYAGSMDLGSDAADIVFAPDGDRAFIVLPDSGVIAAVGTNRLSDEYLTVLATVDFSGIGGSALARAAMSPDGRLLLASDPGAAEVHLVDVAAGSPTEYEITASVPLESGAINGEAGEMAFHPGGEYAYLAVHDPDPAVVLVLDVAPESMTYGDIVWTLTLPGAAPQEIPISLSFTPDGDRCLLLTSQYTGAPNRSVVMLDSSVPSVPVYSRTLSLGGSASPADEHIDVSPRGDRAIANVRESGLFNIEIGTDPDTLSVIQQTGEPSSHATTADGDYAPDASKFYSLSESSDTLSIFDFSAAQTIAVYSGDAQAGVVDEVLPKPLRVRVSGAPGEYIAGVPVEFAVTAGGGHFADTDEATQVVSTNADGIAEVDWVLGPDIGTGAQAASAAASGLTGSPLGFTADGLVDPTTVPLIVTGVKPADSATGVRLGTAIQVAFSRPVDTTSVNSSNFYLHKGDHWPLSAVMGFSGNNSRISLSPLHPLSPLTTYYIEAKTSILDEDSGALDDSLSSSFITESRPSISLNSLSPMSGTAGIEIVVSGTGFNPDLEHNYVYFDALEAYVTGGGIDYISAIVPSDAVTGPVRVQNWSLPDTCNTIDFAVLDADGSLLDNNVVGSVSTTSATRGIAITPDGALAYGVSPWSNLVSVIDLNTLSYLASIPVGDNPLAITIDPEGAFAYVANYFDGTVSTIAVDPASPDYNKVVDVFSVGIGPTDLAITPDSDRLLVANSASSELSVIDTDPLSETYRAVVASVRTSSGARTVAVTPDGAEFYVGVDAGYIVISAESYGVVASVAAGSGSRTVAITPDGALLVILTTDGTVNIYDIKDGSTTENQVVASVKQGSGTLSIAISPDGAFIFMIQELGDAIHVGLLSLGDAFGVTGEGGEVPPAGVEIVMVDTLTAGEDPACIAFDPSGSGAFIVANAGDYTVTVFADEAAGVEPEALFRPMRSFPNPFSQHTTIRFSIPRQMQVRMAVYDVRGRLVRDIMNEHRDAGTHDAVWDGRDSEGHKVSSGIYFCRMEAGEFTQTTKVMMLR